MENKNKLRKNIDHLINWYHGNYCAKCGRIDMKSEEYGQKCMRKMEQIKDSLEVKEITYKQFISIMRHTSFCRPFTRKFDDCKVCKRLGISNNYGIKNWNGWNLSKEDKNI
jgi:hypothetical protein